MSNKKIYRLPGKLVIISILLLFTTLGLGFVSLIGPVGISRKLMSVAEITGLLWIPVLVLAIVLNLINKYSQKEE